MKKVILYVVIILLWIPFWFILGPASIVFYGLGAVFKLLRDKDIESERREQAVRDEDARRRQAVKDLIESNKSKANRNSEKNQERVK